jgi:hypothetical protein
VEGQVTVKDYCEHQWVGSSHHPVCSECGVSLDDIPKVPSVANTANRRAHALYPKVMIAWMRDKIPGEGDFTVFINEQDQAGGFKYSIIDYEPDDPENWVKLFITTEDPARPSADAATERIEGTDNCKMCRTNLVRFHELIADRDEEARRLASDLANFKEHWDKCNAHNLEAENKRLSDLRDEALRQCNELAAQNQRLKFEIEMLRRYGNKDCTAMADEALKDHGR